MTKVVIGSLKRPKSKAGKRSVAEKRVRDNEGTMKVLHTLDAGSRTFGTDLQYVFGRNVAKARRENKRTIGSADVVVAKR